jgi:hypothetical protein
VFTLPPSLIFAGKAGAYQSGDPIRVLQKCCAQHNDTHYSDIEHSNDKITVSSKNDIQNNDTQHDDIQHNIRTISTLSVS